jgi:hypothetical protein
MSASEVYQYSPQTATGTIRAQELQGVFCSASSSLTLAIYDGKDSTGAPIVTVFTLTAGTFYRLPFRLLSGNLAWVVGGSGNFSWAFN